jgi:hypothetical protein
MNLAADQLAHFLGQLRDQHVFSIGVREWLRAEQVRQLLSGRSEELDSQAWTMHIAPVVCVSLEEQQKLRRVLDEYCADTPTSLAAGSAEKAPTKTMSAWVASWRPKPSWLIVAIISLGICCVVLWWHLVNGRSKSIPPQYTRFANIDLANYATNFRIMAVLFPWVLLSLFLLWRWDRRLMFFRQLRPRGSRSSHYRFGAHATPHFPPAEVARYLPAFQARWARGRPRFAEVATVRRASARAGYAEPQFQISTTTPLHPTHPAARPGRPLGGNRARTVCTSRKHRGKSRKLRVCRLSNSAIRE